MTATTPADTTVFGAVTGHLPARRLLDAALAQKRLGHAYLLSGPEGVGKAHVALQLATALLCSSHELRPCHACASCQRIARGDSYELHRIEPEGNQIVIKQIRELGDLMRTSGARGVAIIDPADSMQAPVANALLKTLEEPPPGWLLILISARPDALLPTIRSRCQQVAFQPLSRVETEQVLSRSGVQPNYLPLLTDLASGAPGSVLDEATAEDGGAVLAELFATTVGALAPERLSSPSHLFHVAEQWGTDLPTTRRCLGWWQLWISEALTASYGAPPSPAVCAAVGWDAADWASRFAPGSLTAMLEEIDRVSGLLMRNINRQTALEALLVTLAAGRIGAT